ncbi:protein of unknown function [Burkholderia multivorans]
MVGNLKASAFAGNGLLRTQGVWAGLGGSALDVPSFRLGHDPSAAGVFLRLVHVNGAAVMTR